MAPRFVTDLLWSSVSVHTNWPTPPPALAAERYQARHRGMAGQLGKATLGLDLKQLGVPGVTLVAGCNHVYFQNVSASTVTVMRHRC
jgi:hypothetical protein